MPKRLVSGVIVLLLAALYYGVVVLPGERAVAALQSNWLGALALESPAARQALAQLAGQRLIAGVTALIGAVLVGWGWVRYRRLRS